MELKGFEQIFTDENLAESDMFNVCIENVKDGPEPGRYDDVSISPEPGANIVTFELIPPDSFLGVTTTEPWNPPVIVGVGLYPNEHRVKTIIVRWTAQYENMKGFEIEDKEVFDRVWNFMKEGQRIINDKWLKEIEEIEEIEGMTKNEKSNGNTDGPDGCSP